VPSEIGVYEMTILEGTLIGVLVFLALIVLAFIAIGDDGGGGGGFL
jgi:hypothetical protein